MTPHPDATARPATEDRLRAALTARASLLTPHDLRPAAPPGGRTWGTRRVHGAVLAAAVAAAVAVLLTLVPTGTPTTSVPPARNPSRSTAPAPPATPAPAPPAPSVTAPGPLP
ncbi:hypothetical protein ACFVZH_30280 [Streptomyces sp. NPDC059534]|uniref:hypothetical protein n=1 Tax=Streptomyces sp. NPDC059534 TaxID=3346859 RepID=UPI003690A3A8